MSERICIVVPSRRPASLRAMVESVHRTANGSVKVVAYIDEDMRDQADIPGCQVTVGPRIGSIASYNELVEEHGDHEIYGLLVDDCTFTMVGWDRRVIREFERWPDRIVTLGARPAHLQHIQFPFVSRQWVHALGFAVEPSLKHFTPDTIIQTLGEATRIVYADLGMVHTEEPSIDHHLLDGDAMAFVMWCATKLPIDARRLRAEIRP